jgi:hypothetical protein
MKAWLKARGTVALISAISTVPSLIVALIYWWVLCWVGFDPRLAGLIAAWMGGETAGRTEERLTQRWTEPKP